MATETGRALCRRLIASADIVVENYSPRVFDEWGLDFDSLQRANPGLIMLRMPAFGLTGPWRDRVGYAQTMEHISGLSWISGQSDRDPVTLYGPADPIGGCHGLIGVLFALEHRRRTGEGMLVEAPQIGGVLNLAAEQVIEYSAYGSLLERQGNRSPWAAPQGVYLCADLEQDGRLDTWVAIAVEDDEQWPRLRRALGDPDWMMHPSLDTHPGRNAVHDRIDDAIASWCSARSAEQVLDELASAAVPAGRVINAHESVSFEQLWDRGFFEWVAHPITGINVHSGFPARFGNGPVSWHRRPAPLLGQHNRELLTGLLGLTDQEVEHLHEDGVIGFAVGGGKAW
jgi:crotonobetainyl-CoA:carnitine CoA-transferase CaiB-like acyl-CoA transferase